MGAEAPRKGTDPFVGVISNQVVLHALPQFIKRIPDPHDSRRWNYVGTIPALEAVKILRGTANPREANLKGNVADDIRTTIHNEPRSFHFMNRGLIISAPEADLDTDNKTVTLENPTVANASVLWSLLDGGHTFDVLKEQAAAAAADSGASFLAALKDTWVDVKIRVGLSKDEVISAALANNTSAQLRPWTLAIIAMLRKTRFSGPSQLRAYEVGHRSSRFLHLSGKGNMNSLLRQLASLV